MKAKISLGSGGIKGLILKHVEKAVVAFAVLFFIFLVWGASKLGGDFDLQPDELQTASVEADKAIREPKKGPPEEVPPWEKIADSIKKPIPADPYRVDKTWMHRLFPGATLRGEPAVYPVEKLRASTGFGGISVSGSGALTGGSGGSGGAMAGEMAGYGMEGGMDGGYGGGGLGGNTEGRRWVVVTGLLPYKKQWDEYGNVFRNAEVKLPQRDVPAYILYDVERAEVVPGVEPKDDAWKPLKFYKEFQERKWAGGQPEIVSQRFIHRSASVIPMAYPLPPMVSKSFGPEIAHEPEIPLYYEVERVVEKVEIDWDSLSPAELIEAKKKYGGRMGTAGYGGMGGSGEGYGSGYEQDYGAGGMEGYGAEMAMGGYGGEMGSGGYGGEMGAGYGAVTGPRREIPKYQLFRFFDFSAKPGRYYQYRVRMHLSNPNHELPPQNLEDEKLSEEATLITEWSVPTKVVNVPLDSRVLAGPVSVSANVNVPPKGELGMVNFDADTGEELAEKFTVYRGQLLNYRDVEVKEEEPSTSMGGYGEEMGGYGSEMGGSGGSAYGEAMGGYGAPKKKDRRSREPKAAPETVNFVTEMLLLDFVGGASLPGSDRNMKEPGCVLLMDPAGNLILQEELADQEEYIGFFPPEVKKKKVETDGGYGEEGGYGSMMMQGGEQ